MQEYNTATQQCLNTRIREYKEQETRIQKNNKSIEEHINTIHQYNNTTYRHNNTRVKNCVNT